MKPPGPLNSIPLPFLLLSSFLIAPGCIDLSPQPDPTRFYVLNGPMGNVPSGQPGGLQIGISRIDLPDYLRTPKMVVRQSEFEVVNREFHRWAEDLDRSLGRILAAHLGARPFVRSVDVVPWDKALEHDFRIALQFDRFEGDAAGNVRLRAQWTISDAPAGAPIHTGHSAVNRRWDGKDYAGLAEALSDALAAMSGDIATALKRQL